MSRQQQPPPTDRPPSPGADDSHHDTTGTPQPRGRLATLWSAVTAVIGAVMGLLPHLLHHAGLLVGAALITGVGGNLLFGALGLLFSIPLLRRLYRRFGTWKAPGAAIAVFAVMFSLSAFVIGPAISDSGSDTTPGPVQTPTPEQHGEHHSG